MPKSNKNKSQEKEPAWLSGYHEDNKRHLGALKEDFAHGLKAIGEQYSGVKKTLDSHTEMIGEIMTDVDTLKQDVGVLKSDMQTVKSDIQTIKTDMRHKTNGDEFSQLERRVARLEAHKR